MSSSSASSQSWSFTIPGQPPSVNKSYRITQQQGMRSDGTAYVYRTLSKRQAVLDYQSLATAICRTKKPKGWKPDGFIRVELTLFVHRHIDADNTIKAILDSIQEAVGINDKWFLPCVQAMHVGTPVNECFVEVRLSAA